MHLILKSLYTNINSIGVLPEKQSSLSSGLR